MNEKYGSETRAEQRKFNTFQNRGAVLLAVLFTLMLIEASGANAFDKHQDDPVLVLNDSGGNVRHRLREIAGIRERGQQVQIGGRHCLSSCTMYLVLDATCVSPETAFGFHGPSFHGRQLSNTDFEYWSQVIADHYPEPIKSWYMREGRQRLDGFYRISGADLIQMGVRSCLV